MEIRRVDKDDNYEAIGDIYANSWKAAYQGIVPKDYLDKLNGKKWLPVLENSKYEAFVIMDGLKYIGTASICSARGDMMEGWGEMVSIYLLPEYFGTGYAKPLLDFVVNVLEGMGYKNIYLWVLEENVRAQKFYEKYGFYHNGDKLKRIEMIDLFTDKVVEK